MNFRNKINFFFLVTICVFFFINCSKKEILPKNLEINNFIWGGMNAYYKWQSEVPDLSDKKKSNKHEFNNYLASYSSPENLFYNLLSKPNEYPKRPKQVFSWIVKNYIDLEKSFQGRRLTSGIKVIINTYKNGSDSLYVCIRDVVSGSGADKKGLKRGVIFNKINDQYLLKSNYIKLFNNNRYQITLVDNFNNGNPIAGTKKIELIKSEISENPIKISKVIFHNNKKIGYLMYNQFSSNYDSELNAAFLKFKSEGITDLILDLRYNGGGSIRSAVYLGSMITGQFKDKIYAKQIWNEKVMRKVKNKNIFNSYFTDKIIKKDRKGNIIVDERINSVYMSTVYIIVSEKTASASELVINALKPYIDVKLVGSETVGKQVGSITLYDGDGYTKKNINPNHKWAMQPIVLEIMNKNNQNNPQGYKPEIQIKEIPSKLGIIGNINEPLLSRTIQYITSGARNFSHQISTSKDENLWNPDMNNLDYQKMYIDIK